MSKLTLAQQYEKHDLYEHAVQCAETEIDFVIQIFKSLRQRSPLILREDFCGTANVCCEWVKRDPQHIAIGVDLDQRVLDWGLKNNINTLAKNQQQQITLLNENVLDAKTPFSDIVLAMNFSYNLFKKRQQLLAYFKKVYANLKSDGIFLLDIYGGYDSFQVIEEKREIDVDDPFTYIWEQAEFNPINHHFLCHIHFEFSDGSRMEKAFSYDWRLWTLPELKNILKNAGFKQVLVYPSDDMDETPIPVTSIDADPSWVCYLAAIK